MRARRSHRAARRRGPRAGSGVEVPWARLHVRAALTSWAPRGHAARPVDRPADHPRPLLRRAAWSSLDGEWEFAWDEHAACGGRGGRLRRSHRGAVRAGDAGQRARRDARRSRLLVPAHVRRAGRCSRASACCCTSARSTTRRRSGSTAARSRATRAATRRSAADVTGAARADGGAGAAWSRADRRSARPRAAARQAGVERRAARDLVPAHDRASGRRVWLETVPARPRIATVRWRPTPRDWALDLEVGARRARSRPARLSSR